MVLLACLGVLTVAGWLTPDPRGYGTHQHLRWGRWFPAECGWLTVTGYPCPTCGMTTAFSHAVRGQFPQALMAQPAGLVLALFTAAMTIIAARAIVTGRWFLPQVLVFRPHWFFLGLLALLLGGWAFKLAVGVARGTFPIH